jgi:hypothetical protein
VKERDLPAFARVSVQELAIPPDSSPYLPSPCSAFLIFGLLMPETRLQEIDSLGSTALSGDAGNC